MDKRAEHSELDKRKGYLEFDKEAGHRDSGSTQYQKLRQQHTEQRQYLQMHVSPQLHSHKAHQSNKKKTAPVPPETQPKGYNPSQFQSLSPAQCSQSGAITQRFLNSNQKQFTVPAHCNGSRYFTCHQSPIPIPINQSINSQSSSLCHRRKLLDKQKVFENCWNSVNDNEQQSRNQGNYSFMDKGSSNKVQANKSNAHQASTYQNNKCKSNANKDNANSANPDPGPILNNVQDDNTHRSKRWMEFVNDYSTHTAVCATNQQKVGVEFEVGHIDSCHLPSSQSAQSGTLIQALKSIQSQQSHNRSDGRQHSQQQMSKEFSPFYQSLQPPVSLTQSANPLYVNSPIQYSTPQHTPTNNYQGTTASPRKCLAHYMSFNSPMNKTFGIFDPHKLGDAHKHPSEFVYPSAVGTRRGMQVGIGIERERRQSPSWSSGHSRYEGKAVLDGIKYFKKKAKAFQQNVENSSNDTGAAYNTVKKEEEKDEFQSQNHQTSNKISNTDVKGSDDSDSAANAERSFLLMKKIEYAQQISSKHRQRHRQIDSRWSTNHREHMRQSEQQLQQRIATKSSKKAAEPQTYFSMSSSISKQSRNGCNSKNRILETAAPTKSAALVAPISPRHHHHHHDSSCQVNKHANQHRTFSNMPVSQKEKRKKQKSDKQQPKKLEQQQLQLNISEQEHSINRVRRQGHSQPLYDHTKVKGEKKLFWQQQDDIKQTPSMEGRAKKGLSPISRGNTRNSYYNSDGLYDFTEQDNSRHSNHQSQKGNHQPSTGRKREHQQGAAQGHLQMEDRSKGEVAYNEEKGEVAYNEEKGNMQLSSEDREECKHHSNAEVAQEKAPLVNLTRISMPSINHYQSFSIAQRNRSHAPSRSSGKKPGITTVLQLSSTKQKKDSSTISAKQLAPEKSAFKQPQKQQDSSLRSKNCDNAGELQSHKQSKQKKSPIRELKRSYYQQGSESEPESEQQKEQNQQPLFSRKKKTLAERINVQLSKIEQLNRMDTQVIFRSQSKNLSKDQNLTILPLPKLTRNNRSKKNIAPTATQTMPQRQTVLRINKINSMTIRPSSLESYQPQLDHSASIQSDQKPSFESRAVKKLARSLENSFDSASRPTYRKRKKHSIFERQSSNFPNKSAKRKSAQVNFDKHKERIQRMYDQQEVRSHNKSLEKSLYKFLVEEDSKISRPSQKKCKFSPVKNGNLKGIVNSHRTVTPKLNKQAKVRLNQESPDLCHSQKDKGQFRNPLFLNRHSVEKILDNELNTSRRQIEKMKPYSKLGQDDIRSQIRKIKQYQFVQRYMTNYELEEIMRNYIRKSVPPGKWPLLIIDEVYSRIRVNQIKKL